MGKNVPNFNASNLTPIFFFFQALLKPAKEIEGKREDESMKQFRERIRNETKLVRE
jgi:hypothetical protein